MEFAYEQPALSHSTPAAATPNYSFFLTKCGDAALNREESSGAPYLKAKISQETKADSGGGAAHGEALPPTPFDALRKIAGETSPGAAVSFYECLQCGESFLKRKLLFLHQRVHFPDVTNPYEERDKRLVAKYMAKYPTPINYNYSGTLSTDDFLTLTDNEILFGTSHDSEYNGVNETSYIMKEFVCSQCDASFAFADRLARHSIVHSGDRPWACNRGCTNVSFKSRRDLAVHASKVHSIRGAAASAAAAAAQTTESETNPKPQSSSTASQSSQEKTLHICPECDASFEYPGMLKQHVSRIHAPQRNRPFACPVCDMRFSQRGHLEKHSSVHDLSSRPFVCQYCPCGFKNSRVLMIHLSKMRGDGIHLVE
ncbi:hypothetical protein HK100_000761 [Physocladia obscura]|uniref:C2H2-type domain-containing protein n=1 Tax=Physocladia obscura TaxID=109957 RepID=A0AAD5T0P9_9FUNG|nr:hypothetical protein HK100_000761 [Physocladia obscura]